jgi:hypothetical protein
MRKIIPIAAALAAVAALVAAPARGDEPKTRAEVCREAAKTQHFGIHFIRRDRWIRRCIRGEVGPH